MFERFTERARKVVVLAQEEARLLRHGYIGTEHLLLGLMREEEGVAAQSLTALSLSLDDVHRRVEAIVGYGEEEPGSQAPFTPRSKRALELSLKEAMQLGHNYVGTEHLLLGLTDEPEGVASKVLANSGVERDAVRRVVLQMLGEEDPGPATPDSREISTGVVGRVVEDVMRRLRRGESGTPNSPGVVYVRIEDLEVDVRYGPDAETSPPRKTFLTLDYSHTPADNGEARNAARYDEVIEYTRDLVEREAFDDLGTLVRGTGARISEGFPDIGDPRVAVRPDEVESSCPVGNVTIWTSTEDAPRFP